MVNMRRAADHATYVAARIGDWEQQVRADERKRVAQKIETMTAATHTDWAGQRVVLVKDAARIARGGDR